MNSEKGYGTSLNKQTTIFLFFWPGGPVPPRWQMEEDVERQIGLPISPSQFGNRSTPKNILSHIYPYIEAGSPNPHKVISKNHGRSQSLCVAKTGLKDQKFKGRTERRRTVGRTLGRARAEVSRSAQGRRKRRRKMGQDRPEEAPVLTPRRSRNRRA